MAEHLLPSSASQLERDLSLSMARLEDVPVPIREIHRPQECPEELLPWLAWEYRVDVWDESWPVQVRRDIIDQAAGLHELRGTALGIERVLGIIGFPDAIVIEDKYVACDGIDIPICDGSYLCGSQPWFRFDVNIRTGSKPTSAQENNILKLISRYKNARSRLQFLLYNDAILDGVSIPICDGTYLVDGSLSGV